MLLAAVCFALAACGGQSQADTASGSAGEAGGEGKGMQLFFTLNLDQASNLVKNESDLVVIDVRSAHEFAQGHIPGALNIDAESGGFADEIATLDRDAQIFVYETDENVRADMAIARLKELGFVRVNRLADGFEEWKEAGNPYVQDLP